MNGGFKMLRSCSKNHQHLKEFNYLSDDMKFDAGRWRRACCRTKSMFFIFICVVFTVFIFSNLFVEPHTSRIWSWSRVNGLPQAVIIETQQSLRKCGGEGEDRNLLPSGIKHETSNLELQPLGKSLKRKTPNTLLAVAAGIKQKRFVNRIVEKFLEHNSTIMLFHYDGVVDKWHDLSWSSRALHIVAMNQTKWWFAKRFLHPDVVAPYEYIFLWDEDLGVENFHVDRFLKIMENEGLEISQPALDPNASSEIHHRITVRSRKYRVHRRSMKPKGTGTLCFENSTDPPCTGWVEGMAPVFTRDAWKCVWHLIQNDLVHGWGLDFKLGYCVKGNRLRNVGVIDSEYIVHRGIPSLGGSARTKDRTNYRSDPRSEVRRRSFAELSIFSQRWRKAVKEDECWRDPYKHQMYYGPPDKSRSYQYKP